MPHVIVKLWPGRSEEQKKELTNRIVAAVMDVAQVPEHAVSVGLEEVPRERWDAEVRQPDIIGKAGTLYKKPGI